MPTIALKDHALAFDDVGDIGTPVVLLHGHPFDRTMWTPQLAHFWETGRRAIAPDLRGYGESAPGAGVRCWSDFAEDVAALLDQLALDQAVVVGLSMGGQIAMELARRWPERLRGLVLAATFPHPETEDGKRRRADTAARLEREGMAEHAAELLPRMLASSTIAAQPRVADQVLRMMRDAHPAGAAAALRARAARPDYRPTLARLHCPALVVAGDADAYTTRAQVDEMCALIPRAELLWLPGAGHMPNLEHAEAFNDALDRFVHALAMPASVAS